MERLQIIECDIYSETNLVTITICNKE